MHDCIAAFKLLCLSCCLASALTTQFTVVYRALLQVFNSASHDDVECEWFFLKPHLRVVQHPSRSRNIDLYVAGKKNEGTEQSWLHGYDLLLR